MSQRNRRRPDLITAWPHSPGFAPLAEQAAELPGDMLTDAILESVCPEPVTILLEIKGGAEQLTSVTAALKNTGLIVNIISQQHQNEDEEEEEEV